MTSTLNQKSQMSDAFGIGLVRGKIGNNGGEKDGYIRGVPKFVDGGTAGMRYANEREMEQFDGSMFESAHMYDYSLYRNNNMHGEGDTMEGGTERAMLYLDSTMKDKEHNKFKEEWYPEGIDQDKRTFLKRSLRNHSFNPNRTFTSAAGWNPGDSLIPKLFVQSNETTVRKHRRNQTSELTKIVRDN